MVRKRSAILCGHIGRQAWSETWRAVTVLVCLGNEGSHDLELWVLQPWWFWVNWDGWSPQVGSVHFSSAAQSCPTLCDPMDCSTPGFPVHHQLPEFTQTQVHRVGDAIQPSHPLSSPSPPASSLCQHQGLFQWVSSSHQVPKVLEFQLHHQSFQWIFRTEFPSDGVVGYPCSPRDSQESSPTQQFKSHEFFSVQLSVQSNSLNQTWLMEKP